MLLKRIKVFLKDLQKSRTEMRYISAEEIAENYRCEFNIPEGAPCIRDMGLLASAAARPAASFGGEDLYKTLPEKAGVLLSSLVHNHAFIDGNKRISYMAMRTMLILNGYDIRATEDEKYSFVLGVAKGKIKDKEVVSWISDRLVKVKDNFLTNDGYDELSNEKQCNELKKFADDLKATYKHDKSKKQSKCIEQEL